MEHEVRRSTGQYESKEVNRRWRYRWTSASVSCLVFAMALIFAPQAHAGFVGSYTFGQWTLINQSADGSVAPTLDGIQITGGNTGSGDPGATDFVITAPASGAVTFSWTYFSLDLPTVDNAGFLLNGVYTVLADASPHSGAEMFSVSAGQTFGFRVATADNQFDPGILTISNFSGPEAVGQAPAVPEPGTAGMMFLAITAAAAFWRGMRLKKPLGSPELTGRLTRPPVLLLVVGLLASISMNAQVHYTGTTATGRLVLTRQVNLMQMAQSSQSHTSLPGNGTAGGPDWNRNAPPTLLRPAGTQRATGQNGLLADPQMQTLLVNPSTTASLHVAGISHYDMRNANGGNQFSIEPPSQGLAVGNGYIAEGVNNAFQVYSLSGTPLLPVVLTTNQVFGLAPAIDRNTDIQGPYPTDIRVFYDADIRRWFILQRVADNDSAGNVVFQSQIYLAVSQTDVPTGTFNIYVIDTTNLTRPGCPCISDYPAIGADKNGFYISSNEFDFSFDYRDVSILAISKAGLAAGAATPTLAEFVIPPSLGYEFTVFPATTPPGASYFTANGGLEYFVSSQASLISDSQMALWAMTNTASLGTATPDLALVEITIPTLTYSYPPVARQPAGPLPYGSTVGATVPPAIDGGDLRVLSVIYSGGRLYVTLATQVRDKFATALSGGAFLVISPAYRVGTLTGSALRQGYLMVEQNNLLRPSIAVDAQGRGAIVFTLVGPGYYPSAAFVPFSSFTPSNTIQIAAAGALPEDGFTAYDYPFIARWGDYSAAVVGDDGKIYMATEFIPSGLRTEFANWGTALIGILPQ
uniref:PEP-CTERM protein-sorting domain-containing protein n=1 Tax=Solibacter usitatus (strain Ellin6076) TaxID=234267 RepID=Q01TC6_SOLUE